MRRRHELGPCPDPPTNDLAGITFGNGQFVAVDGLATIQTSPDGLNWVERPSATTNRLAAFSYGNGQFVAVGDWQDATTGLEFGGTIVTSADGVNWTQRLSGTTNPLFGVGYGNGHFVAVGGNGTILNSATISTLALTPNTKSGLFSLSLEGAAGVAYTVECSTDLISWQTVTNIISAQPTTFIFDALPAGSNHIFFRAYSQ